MIIVLVFSKQGLLPGLKERLINIINKETPQVIEVGGIVFRGVDLNRDAFLINGFSQFVNTIKNYAASLSSGTQSQTCIGLYYLPKSFVENLKKGHYTILLEQNSNKLAMYLYKGNSLALQKPVIVNNFNSELCIIHAGKLMNEISKNAVLLSTKVGSYAFSQGSPVQLPSDVVLKTVNKVWITKPDFVNPQPNIKPSTTKIEIKNDEGILPVLFFNGKVCFLIERSDWGSGCKPGDDKPELDTDCHKYLRAALPLCNNAVSSTVCKYLEANKWKSCDRYFNNQCEKDGCNFNLDCKLKLKSIGPKYLPICERT